GGASAQLRCHPPRHRARPRGLSRPDGLAALLMNLDDLLGPTLIFLGARAGLGLAVGPVVIAAGGDFQGFAQRANGMLGFHRVNPLKTLDGGSERMPKVFFKMSRCWRR